MPLISATEAVAAVLPEGLVDTFALERFARISAKELDSLRREIVVTCNARSASLSQQFIKQRNNSPVCGPPKQRTVG